MEEYLLNIGGVGYFNGNPTKLFSENSIYSIFDSNSFFYPIETTLSKILYSYLFYMSDKFES